MTTDLPKDIGPRNVEGVSFPLRYEAPTEEHARAVEQAAKKLADLAASRARAQHEAHAALIESWAESVKTDKEIGGEKLAENLAVAKRAVDTFGSPALKELLTPTGLGNPPEVVKAFFKAGKAISEDGFVRGAPKAPATESDLAKSLFPSMK